MLILLFLLLIFFCLNGFVIVEIVDGMGVVDFDMCVMDLLVLVFDFFGFLSVLGLVIFDID